MNDVRPNSEWQHTNGNIYKVLLLTNVESTRPDYPPTVVYQGVTNGKMWSRPLSDWHRSMTFVKDGFSGTNLLEIARKAALEEAAEICDAHDGPHRMVAGVCADDIRKRSTQPKYL